MPESVNRSQDTVSLDSSPTMAMTTLYSAAVGPIGNDYYLPLFSRFEAAGRATVSWNWSACLYTVNWMIFRRLWGAALVAAGAMLGIALLLVALGLLVFEWPHEVLYPLLLADLALGMFASGLWGNALLYNHCRQAMMTAVADNKTLVQACAQLSLHASTRRRFIRLLLVNTVLLALVAAAYVRLVGFGSTETPELDTVPAPALAASAAEPAASSTSAASAASQATSAAVEPTAAVSAPQEATALSAASAASAAPASSQAAMAASARAAASASAMAAVPEVIPPAATLPTASSALATSAAKPAQPQSAAPVVSHASSPAGARSGVAASVHASATAHPASKAAHAASKPAAKVALAKAAKTTATKTSQAAKATPTPRIGLYINAGLFANPDNARNVLAKLQAAGLPATAQELETSQGTRTRIRVGPIAQRAQAEATVQKIKALNLDAALAKP